MRPLTRHVVGLVFAFELPFVALTPGVYTWMLGVYGTSLARWVTFWLLGLYAIKSVLSTAVVVYLAGPADRWLRPSPGGRRDDAALVSAVRAVDRIVAIHPPLNAVGWGLTLWLPAVRMRYGTGEPAIGPPGFAAISLAAVAAVLGVLGPGRAILATSLAPHVGRLSLDAHERGLRLPRKRARLRRRIVALGLTLSLGPITWMVGMSLSYVARAHEREAVDAARAANELAAMLLGAGPAGVPPPALMDLDRAGVADGTVLFAPDGEISGGARGRELLATAPSLQRRIASAAAVSGSGTLSDRRHMLVAVYRRLPEGAILATIRRVSPVVGKDLSFGLAVFLTVATLWASLSAGYFAAYIAGPVVAVARAVEQVARSGSVAKVARLPVPSRDETGRLAEGVNAMLDRLSSAEARTRRYMEALRRALHDSEKQRALHDRRAAELRAVVEHMIDGVFVVDPDGRLKLVNEAGRRFLGLSVHRIEDGPTDLRRIVTAARLRRPDGSPISYEDLPAIRALAGETVVEQDVLVDEPDGRITSYKVSAAPIRGAESSILGAVVVCRDVTVQAELDRFRAQFVDVAAHELRTPLAVIQGYAQALAEKENAPPEERRPMLEGILTGVGRMERIVRELLDVSQLQFGQLPLSMERFDLAAVVEEVAVEVERNRKRRIVTSVTPAVVRADRARTRQIVRYLLDNAIRYSPGGSEVRVSVHVEGERAKVAVEDKGVGIPRERQAGVFTPFFRAHTNTPYDYGGLGVGLYIASQLVRRQGGSMGFHSDPRVGTTFFFDLPLDRT